MSRKVLVAGVGMIPFTKAGASDDYPVMGANAARDRKSTRLNSSH